MISSFEGHDRLKLDILHLTCQKFLHLQEQWQWTWIQSLSSQRRPQRSLTDASHMWCELMRFASSKCMCHGTSILFWFSNDCALLCELLLHLTKLWNLLLDKALTSWMVSNLGFQEEVLVKMGWAPAPLSLSLALRNSQLALLIIHKQYVSSSTLLYYCAATQLQISSSLVILKPAGNGLTCWLHPALRSSWELTSIVLQLFFCWRTGQWVGPSSSSSSSNI